MKRLFVGGFGLLLGAFGTYACIASDATQFGNPNTLSRQNLPGEGGVTLSAVQCAGDDSGVSFEGGCPSFANDIYPYMKPDGKWRCSDPSCHGAASSPHMDCADPKKCFASLLQIQIQGKPYIAPDGGADPSAVRMLCSLQGGCGDKMPKPPGSDLTNGELCLVNAWLQCGSPEQ